MTMKELAALANVSVSTVSKAFQDADDINDETKKHIFDIAKQNGSFGKYYKGKFFKKIIAIIFPEFDNGFYTKFVKLLKNLIENSNYICIMSAFDFSEDKQSELIEYYSSFLKVDGLIVFNLKRELKKGYETPIVSLFTSADSNTDFIKIDTYTALKKAIETLYSYGHRSIVFFGEKHTLEKSDNFKEMCKSCFIREFSIYESDSRFEKAGCDCVEKMLNMPKLPSAVVCAYDYIAVGAIRRLKEHGINVPEDISVIGINNVDICEYTDTSITSIDTQPELVCSQAWKLLESKIKNKYFKSNEQISFEGQLILRESIKKL